MNKLYQKVRGQRDEPNSNRYARIHVMFQELAVIKSRAKAEPGTKEWSEQVTQSYEDARKIKQFWKDFFDVKTLKDLSDERLKEIEVFLEKRIQYEHDRKFDV